MEHHLDWLVTDYGAFLAKFGLAEADVRTHYAVWKERSGRDTATDYLWYLFGVLLGETAKQVKKPLDLYKNNLEIYGAMLFFQTHVLGNAAKELQQRINEMQLLVWNEELPFRYRVRLVAENCCPYCNQRDGSFFSSEDLLRGEGFLVTACSNEAGCSCRLAPLAERDEQNRIVLKTDR